MLSFHPLPVAVQEEKAMASVPQHAIEVHKLSQYFQERQRKKVLLKGEFLVSSTSVGEGGGMGAFLPSRKPTCC